jgi:hypothetical protein
MKRILLSAVALISCVAQADIALHMNFEHRKDDVVRTKSIEWVVAPNIATRISADDLDVTILAQPQDDGVIEFLFEIFENNELISTPVIKIEYNKEAKVCMPGEGEGEEFSLTILAHNEEDAA